jgi:capsular exopolysaccharide synthesis family protein
MQFPKTTNRLELAPANRGYTVEYTVPTPSDTPLIHYWDALLAHKGVIILSIVFCVAVAAAVTYSMSPVYQAKGVLELQTPAQVNYGRDGATADVNGQTFDAYVETQIGILQSDTLIRRVIARVNAANRMAGYQPRGMAAWRAKYIHLASDGPLPSDQVLDVVKKNLNVRQARLNNLIEVYYSANDPKLAADFVNALADEYAVQNLEARWEIAQNAGNWLTRHLADLRTKLESSENELQRYSQANGLLLVDSNENVQVQKLHQMQESLSKAESLRMEKQADMEMAASVKPDSVPQVLDNGAVKEYEVKVADLQRQLADLRQVYTATNPKVQALEVQIATLQKAADQQRSNVLARLRNEFAAAERNEQMLTTSYARQNKLVTNQDEKMIHYNTLKHEVDSNRAIYEALLQRVKETSVSVALQATNVRVVDHAVPPSRPYKPNTPINLGGGLMAGLVVGLAGAALRNRTRPAVRRAGVTQRFMTAPELGVIPSASRGWTPESLEDESGSRASLFRKPECMRAWVSPHSAASESFRAVMTSLLFAVEDPGVRILMVTSPGCGEGKTTLTSNLGAAFAATGRQVLLVDADLRRPRLHSMFGLASSPGVHEFSQEIQADGATPPLDKFVRQTGIKNLFLMASGDCDAGQNSLVQTLRFRETFAALRSHYDMILVDAPPLPWIPESRVMARLADGVVMVVRAGTTRIEDAIAAERYIHQDGGILIGTVLNDSPHAISPYYSRYATTARV